MALDYKTWQELQAAVQAQTQAQNLARDPFGQGGGDNYSNSPLNGFSTMLGDEALFGHYGQDGNLQNLTSGSYNDPLNTRYGANPDGSVSQSTFKPETGIDPALMAFLGIAGGASAFFSGGFGAAGAAGTGSAGTGGASAAAAAADAAGAGGLGTGGAAAGVGGGAVEAASAIPQLVVTGSAGAGGLTGADLLGGAAVLGGGAAAASAGSTVPQSFSDAKYGADTGTDPTYTGSGTATGGATGGGPGVADALSAGKTAAGLGSSLAGLAGKGSLINGGLQALGGVLSANQAEQFGNKTALAADPFSPYRDKFAKQLSAAGAGTSQGPTSLAQGQAANAQLQQSADDYNIARSSTPNLANQFAALGGGSNFGSDYAALGASVAPTRAGQYQAAGQSQQTGNPLQGNGERLQSLLNDPNSIFQDKSYTAAFGQGQEALNRSLATRGQTASGNEMQALQDYGMAQGSNYYNNRINQLSGAYGQQTAESQRQFQDQITGLNGAESSDSRVFGERNTALNGQASESQRSFGNSLASLSASQGANSNAFNQNMAGIAGRAGVVQQGFTDLQASSAQADRQNQQVFNNLGQLSGQSQGDPGAAARAMGQIYGNVNAGYNQAGQGLSQINSALGPEGIAGGIKDALNLNFGSK